MDRNAEDHMQISLAEWAQHWYKNGSLDEIIDPYFQVVYGLKLALQLQESEINRNDANHANDSSSIDYHVLFTSDSGSIRVGR
ncbi:hypothetical protein GOBAR_DD07718 [Gossypium barbadense]|nr:hypothetical protein GOBAR_DD07718 [Gossypium barbadense]